MLDALFKVEHEMGTEIYSARWKLNFLPDIQYVFQLLNDWYALNWISPAIPIWFSSILSEYFWMLKSFVLYVKNCQTAAHFDKLTRILISTKK